MPVITQIGSQPQIDMMRWGLVPSWAQDSKIGYKLINARDDGIFDKPIWRRLILRRRALIPANGFYEWQRRPNNSESKRPLYIQPRNEPLFAFAGLWDAWHDANGVEWRTFAIITTEPNKEMSAVHDRMPVILDPEHEATWLDPNITSRVDIEPLLHPYPDNGLSIEPVGPEVNTPSNNDAGLMYPVHNKD